MIGLFSGVASAQVVKQVPTVEERRKLNESFVNSGSTQQELMEHQWAKDEARDLAIKDSSGAVTANGCAPHPVFGCGKAKPDQCPVCGTMAEPYKRVSEFGYTRKDGRFVPGYYPDGPDERTTRCKRCNSAFYQDAIE